MTNLNDAINDGFAVLIYPNQLGTATVAIIDEKIWGDVEAAIKELPDDQIVDVRLSTTDENIAEGVGKVRRKMNREGEYVDWDEKMRNLGLES